jgi:hypothetical protein
MSQPSLPLVGEEQTGQSDALSVQSHSQDLRPASTTTSFYSASQLSLPLDTGSQAATSSHSRARARELSLLTSFASDALINEMVLNCGWRYNRTKLRIHGRTLWRDKTLESFNFACVALNHSTSTNFHFIYHLLIRPLLDQTTLTSGIEDRMIGSLSSFRSKLVQRAESYAREYLATSMPLTPEQAPDYVEMQETVKKMVNPSDHDKFFLHKQGADVSARVVGTSINN